MYIYNITKNPNSFFIRVSRNKDLKYIDKTYKEILKKI